MTSKTYEVNETEAERRNRRCGCCAFFRFFLTVLAILSVSVLAAFYAFNLIGAPLRVFPGCQEPEVDPYGTSNWTQGANTVTFECNEGHEMEGYVSGKMTSECVNREWVPQPPACVTLPIRIDCQVNQSGLQGTISMWQETRSSPTYVFGFLNTKNVPKVLTSLSEVIELSRAKCHASSVTNVTMPEATPLDQLHQEVEIRFETKRILAYKKAELHLTIVYVDLPKSLTRSVASLHQGDEVVIMEAPPGWPFGTASEDGHRDKEIAIPEHGRKIEPKTDVETVKSGHEHEERAGDSEADKSEMKKIGVLKDAVKETPTSEPEKAKPPAEADKESEAPAETDKEPFTPARADKESETPAQADKDSETPIELYKNSEPPAKTDKPSETAIEVVKVPETPAAADKASATPAPAENVPKTADKSTKSVVTDEVVVPKEKALKEATQETDAKKKADAKLLESAGKFRLPDSRADQSSDHDSAKVDPKVDEKPNDSTSTPLTALHAAEKVDETKPETETGKDGVKPETEAGKDGVKPETETGKDGVKPEGNGKDKPSETEKSEEDAGKEPPKHSHVVQALLNLLRSWFY